MSASARSVAQSSQQSETNPAAGQSPHGRREAGDSVYAAATAAENSTVRWQTAHSRAILGVAVPVDTSQQFEPTDGLPWAVSAVADDHDGSAATTAGSTSHAAASLTSRNSAMVDRVNGLEIERHERQAEGVGDVGGGEEEEIDDVPCSVCSQQAPPPTARGAGGPDHSVLMGCDGPCGRWFHPGCVGLRSAPDGVWYCADCAVSSRDGEVQGGAIASDFPATSSQRPKAAPRRAANVTIHWTEGKPKYVHIQYHRSSKVNGKPHWSAVFGATQVGTIDGVSSKACATIEEAEEYMEGCFMAAGLDINTILRPRYDAERDRAYRASLAQAREVPSTSSSMPAAASSSSTGAAAACAPAQPGSAGGKRTFEDMIRRRGSNSTSNCRSSSSSLGIGSAGGVSPAAGGSSSSSPASARAQRTKSTDLDKAASSTSASASSSSAAHTDDGPSVLLDAVYGLGADLDRVMESGTMTTDDVSCLSQLTDAVLQEARDSSSPALEQIRRVAFGIKVVKALVQRGQHTAVLAMARDASSRILESVIPAIFSDRRFR